MTLPNMKAEKIKEKLWKAEKRRKRKTATNWAFFPFPQCIAIPYSPTILKNILCLFLQNLVNLNVTRLLIG